MIHARPDYNRIQDPDGLIADDMPVFLLLGKDQYAANTVRYWAGRVEAGGGDPTMIKMARAHADVMDGLQNHKQPDLPSQDDKDPAKNGGPDPRNLIAYAEWETSIFERPSTQSCARLIAEIKRLQALLAMSLSASQENSSR